jgi:hypothetical protein
MADGGGDGAGGYGAGRKIGVDGAGVIIISFIVSFSIIIIIIIISIIFIIIFVIIIIIVIITATTTTIILLIIRPGAVVVLDDCPQPSVLAAWSQVKSILCLYLTLIAFSHDIFFSN